MHFFLVFIIEENRVPAVAKWWPAIGLNQIKIRAICAADHHSSIRGIEIIGRQERVLGGTIVDHDQGAGRDIVPHRAIGKNQHVSTAVTDVPIGEAAILEGEDFDPLGAATGRTLTELVDEGRAGELGVGSAEDEATCILIVLAHRNTRSGATQQVDCRSGERLATGVAIGGGDDAAQQRSRHRRGGR